MRPFGSIRTPRRWAKQPKPALLRAAADLFRPTHTIPEPAAAADPARLREGSGAPAAGEAAASARNCRICGCTDDRACAGGCHWVAPGLCSRCAGDAA